MIAAGVRRSSISPGGSGRAKWKPCACR
jgi:hypothetical protein